MTYDVIAIFADGTRLFGLFAGASDLFCHALHNTSEQARSVGEEDRECTCGQPAEPVTLFIVGYLNDRSEPAFDPATKDMACPRCGLIIETENWKAAEEEAVGWPFENASLPKCHEED